MAIMPLYEFDVDTRMLIVRTHLSKYGDTVTGPIEGMEGEIYSVSNQADPLRSRIAAKCPRIKRFGSLERAREGTEKALHELVKTHKVFAVPWVNRFFDVEIIHGWPFILSRYRDGTLTDLIANPLAWTAQDRLASLIQIVRALKMAQDRGIFAHQDLKPANILFDDLVRKGMPKASSGMHYQIFVGDFGIADAFRDFGRNGGSRPYMAPEQYLKNPLDIGAMVRFDIFALGVIAFECFSDGRHPIGPVTTDVWPRRAGIPWKWDQESTWRTWAENPGKAVTVEAGPLSCGLSELIGEALSTEPSARPSLEEFEARLWRILIHLDPVTGNGLRMQIEYFESFSVEDTDWPHMDERVLQLRQFYSRI